MAVGSEGRERDCVGSEGRDVNFTPLHYTPAHACTRPTPASLTRPHGRSSERARANPCSLADHTLSEAHLVAAGLPSGASVDPRLGQIEVLLAGGRIVLILDRHGDGCRTASWPAQYNEHTEPW